KQRKHLNSVLIFIATIWMTGCSNTKFVPQGDFLYTGASVRILSDSLSKKEKSNLSATFEEQLTPKPNKSFFGLRPKLYIYNTTGEPKKDKGFKYWLKNKVGEKPVYLSNVDLPFNLELLENIGENLGYFDISASYDTLSKNKKVQVQYNVSPRSQYLI